MDSVNHLMLEGEKRQQNSSIEWDHHPVVSFELPKKKRNHIMSLLEKAIIEERTFSIWVVSAMWKCNISTKFIEEISSPFLRYYKTENY